MRIFFRALCFHMSSRAELDETEEVSRFIMYRHDEPTPNQSLVTSGLVLSERNTWKEYKITIPSFFLHKWVNFFPCADNINERLVYGGQPAQFLGADSATGMRKREK